MARDTADVVVIGGGIMGMSIAHQIARRSALKVVVLEKGAGLGEGSTGGSSAITRQRYSKLESIRVARDGNVIWRNWAEYTGLSEPVGRLHDIGVLWMMHDSVAEVEADRDRLVAEGIDAVTVDSTDLRKLYPGVSACMVPFDLTGEIEHECADGEAFLIECDTGFFDATGALQEDPAGLVPGTCSAGHRCGAGVPPAWLCRGRQDACTTILRHRQRRPGGPARHVRVYSRRAK